MLTEIYIEALLVDEVLADQVWEAWDGGAIDNQTAFHAWLLIAISNKAGSPPQAKVSKAARQVLRHA